MGGDLNLKKSWHPVLMSNQRRVWEEEKKALDERKRTEQRIKELKEERAKEEIQNKLEAAGSRKRVDRVDWMYQGPSSGQAGTTEEMEGYLLGKRRIDSLIKGTEHKKLEKQAAEDSFMALQNANTVRDTAAKIREDPMLAIKRQEQAAYEAMMNDPIKRRALLASITGGDGKSDKKDRKHKHHHRRHRDDGDGERRHKRRKTEDYDDRRRRGRSPRRRQSDSATPESRSVSPQRRERHQRRRSVHSASPPRKQYEGSHGQNRGRQGKEYRRRSASASSRSRSRSASSRGRSNMDTYDQRSYRNHNTERMSRGEDRRMHNTNHGPSRKANGFPRKALSADRDMERQKERERKLAAMQKDATALDLDRDKRLTALAEQEKADREADDRLRAESSKYGDSAKFVNALHKKTGDMSLGDRIGRNRQGYQRED